MKYISQSEIGLVRKTNQDRILTCQNEHAFLAMVCDGIGGANGGDLASQMSVDAFERAFLDASFTSIDGAIEWFSKTLNVINHKVLTEARNNIQLKGMGTTCAAVIIINNRAVGFNIGDSRVYDYRRNRLSVLSHDQTYAYMMYMQNEISIEDVQKHPKRNVLMNAIGVNEVVSFETIRIPDGWNRLMVCSDGLYGYVLEDKLENAMTLNLKDAGDKLMDEAIKAGGFDNISLILIEEVGHG